MPNTGEKGKKSKKKQNIIAVTILVAGTLAAWLILGPEKPAEEPAPEMPVEVETMIVSQAAANTSLLSKTVTLSSMEDADVVSEFTGRIREVRFAPGDIVNRGQVLAVFDQSARENSPKVSLDSARRSFELAEKNLEQTREVAEESVDIAENSTDLARKELDKAKAGVDANEIKIAREKLDIAKSQEDQAEGSKELQINSAKIQLEQARLQLDQARIEHEKTIIKAPISGRVTTKNVRLGNFITSGTRIAQIAGNNNLEASVFLNREEINRIKEGDEADIQVGGEAFKGTIDAISTVANADNERFEVRIITREPLQKFSNSAARVALKLSLDGSSGAKFFVPLRAVVLGQRQTKVFVVEKGTARAREAQVGTVIGEQVEILGGLSEGDELIVEGSRSVQDGQSVIKRSI